MQGELKDKVARGVAWSLAEKVSTTLLQLGVRIVLLRLLTREDFGIMAILTAISAVMLVVADSGFSQTLIRHREPSRSDFKSVFVFNVVLSLLLYVALVATAPLYARFFDAPVLAALAPVFFLILPLNALCVIQNTIFTRQFRFALLSKVTFFASMVSGFTAVGLVVAGCGVWSLVVERVVLFAVRAAMLWWLSAWRPGGVFDGRALQRMAPFSCSLMATDLISAFYNKLPQFFLGRMYPAETLGSFDQAVKLKDQPVNSLMQAVQGVTFPALSKIGDDDAKFAESYRQVVMVVTYAIFPVMLGLSAVAPDLFAVLLGEKWMSTVPYFEVACLAGLFYPVAMIAYNVLKVKSGGGLIVKLEIAKKAVMTVIFALTIPFSVQAVIWGLVAISLSETIINFSATRRFTAYSFRGLGRTLLPVALVSGAMYAAVRLTIWLLPATGLLRLMAGIAVGAVVYLLLSVLYRLEAFREVAEILKKVKGER